MNHTYTQMAQTFTISHLAARPGKVSGRKGREVQHVPMLLPHEILDAVFHAGDVQACVGSGLVFKKKVVWLSPI